MHDSVQRVTLNWGIPRLRNLPWRHTRDPWLVLVSEVMLQQTQVDRVIPKWHAFVEAYPDPATCARASLGDVLRLWQGLGYPRRAMNLHCSAQIVVEQGRFPADLQGLLALPGVGPYTARAILAFAFEQDAAVVETNIARVLARYVGASLKAAQVQEIADQALVKGESWVWNQTLMDLGAVLCRPAQPGCARCPLAATCSWRGIGNDPAVGSAGVSTSQSRFAGSDRQGRGRLLRHLGERALAIDDLARAMGWPEQPERANRVCAGMIAEGLVVTDEQWLRLP